MVFRAKLENASEKDPDQFKITLGKAELGASSRFSRRFGSKSFVRVKIHKSLQNSKYSEALIDFFRRPFIIAGKVFRAFFEKEKTVFLVSLTHLTNTLPSFIYLRIFQYMTNEVPEWELVLGSTQKVPGRLSFEDFLQWHNPIEPNQQQVRLQKRGLDIKLTFEIIAVCGEICIAFCIRSVNFSTRFRNQAGEHHLY